MKQVEEHFGNRKGHHWFEAAKSETSSYPDANDWKGTKGPYKNASSNWTYDTGMPAQEKNRPSAGDLQNNMGSVIVDISNVYNEINVKTSEISDISGVISSVLPKISDLSGNLSLINLCYRIF